MWKQKAVPGWTEVKKLVDSIHVVYKVGAIINVGPQKTFRFWCPKVLTGIVTFLSFPITLSFLGSGFFWHPEHASDIPVAGTTLLLNNSNMLPFRHQNIGTLINVYNSRWLFPLPLEFRHDSLSSACPPSAQKSQWMEGERRLNVA